MPDILPVITLYQPWATWIMRGWKTIETRTHDHFKSLAFREILIHAGQTTDNTDAAIRNPYLTHDQIIQNPDEMINGFILGCVYVSDFRLLNSSHSSKALIDCESINRFGLFLTVINKFEKPIPVKGEMGIWYYDIKRLEKVKKIILKK